MQESMGKEFMLRVFSGFCGASLHYRGQLRISALLGYQGQVRVDCTGVAWMFAFPVNWSSLRLVT